MEGQSPEQALARIEAALARIEAAASRPRPANEGPADDGLAARHAALRSAVAESLHALDGLIARGGA